MKIAKTKEVITEEIEVNPGTYYFKCSDDIYYKMVIEEEDNTIYYKQEAVEYFSDVKGIRIREDSCLFGEEEELPYKFRYFILGDGGKKIEKEEFEQQKQEVIKRITDERKK